MAGEPTHVVWVCPLRLVARNADSLFVPPQQEAESECQDHVDDHEDEKALPEAEGCTRVEADHLGEFAHSEDREKRRVLHQSNEIVAQSGQHVPDRLGKDDPPGDLSLAETYCTAGFGLPFWHRLDAGSKHLGDERCIEER